MFNLYYTGSSDDIMYLAAVDYTSNIVSNFLPFSVLICLDTFWWVPSFFVNGKRGRCWMDATFVSYRWAASVSVTLFQVKRFVVLKDDFVIHLFMGLYFCFQIFSEQRGKMDMRFIVCAIYLLLGMALIAMCFNLMQVNFYQSFNIYLLY